MEITQLVKQYFSSSTNITIDVFDEKNIYSVYQRIINMLMQYMEIETSVLQAMSYCFYEILDNVLTHSNKQLGTVITQYDAAHHQLNFLVADDGIGIHNSLLSNAKYTDITEPEALLSCIKDAVTDGKGMGFGLYSTARLAHNAGLRFEIHSGSSRLVYDKEQPVIENAAPWQGTVVYMALQTNKEISPQEVVANRTDAVADFNDAFLQDNELEELW